MQRLRYALKKEEDFDLTNLLELLEGFLKDEDNIDKQKLQKVSSLIPSFSYMKKYLTPTFSLLLKTWKSKNET